MLRLLELHQKSIEARLGGRIVIKSVVARDDAKDRPAELPRELLSFDPDALLARDDLDVIVEVIGGVEPAGTFVRRAIESGRNVVTANKALLAARGHELIELAEQRGVDLYFEAAVGGGIPIIRTLREAVASDRIVSVRGIVNGTSNYVLTRMRDESMGFDDAIAAAQKAGFAEADPSLDVDGGDAAHKLTILATLAFGARIDPRSVMTESIRPVGAIDIAFARRFGYVVKQLAIARDATDDAGRRALDLRVHPALVREGTVLASIGGSLNAIYLEGQALGPCLLAGHGAGALPTAVSVVSDIIDVGRNLLADASGRVPQRAFPTEALADIPVRDPGELIFRYYLRFTAHDRPGVLARIAGVLGAFDVSIEQMVQEGRGEAEDRPVAVVMLTHPARERDVRRALKEIDGLASIAEPTRWLRIEDR